MKILQLGSKGDDVLRWQSFLHGNGYESVALTSRFDAATEKGTRAFQLMEGLQPDGKVGPQTVKAAAVHGFGASTVGFPAKPAFASPSLARVKELFGDFNFKILTGGAIRILGDWQQKNIVKVHIPQLAGVEGAPKDCLVYFHRRGARQLQALFAAWEKAGLMHNVKTWAGSFVARMVRGSATKLSNHAFGSAFDINAAWNGLGKTPAAADQAGTVIPLVAIANAHGFYWGGHYSSRPDGMHFELAALDMFPSASEIESSQVPAATAATPAYPTVIPSNQDDVPVITSAASATADSGDAENDPVGNNAFLSSPAGDAPAEPPVELNVEDYKPFVKRWLKRVWSAFTGGNFMQGFALTAAAARDSEHWYVYAGIAATVFLILLLCALGVSIVLGAILWNNRKEIGSYFRLAKQSELNPAARNLRLVFEKK